MPLVEVENFHPEEGMILANTTSVGMKPNIDETPIPKVHPPWLFPCYNFIDERR